MLPSTLTPDYRFNPAAGATGRYIDRRGRFVPAKTVTTQMERVIAGTRGEMTMLSQRLQAGDIGLQEWYDGMRGKMKIIHTASASIAKGGWAQMTPADWGAVGAITKQQYKYLNAFAEQIANGLPLDGRFLYRAGMYADAARGKAEDMRRREAAGKGLEYERRVRAISDSCPDCIKYEAEGWQPIGTLPAIGNSVCKTNCRCHFIYGQLVDEQIVEVASG